MKTKTTHQKLWNALKAVLRKKFTTPIFKMKKDLK